MEHKSSLQCLTSTNCISLARQSSMSTTCILVLLLLGSLFLESIRSQESHVQKLTYGKLCLYYTDPHTPASWVPACSTCGTYMQWVLEVLCQCCIPFCEIATTQLAVFAGVVLPLLCRKLGSCWWRCRLPGMWRRRGTSSSWWVSHSACLHAPQNEWLSLLPGKSLCVNSNAYTLCFVLLSVPLAQGQSS